MGCSVSVFLANTFMANRMRGITHGPNNDLLFLTRYIDDIIGVSRVGSEELIKAKFDKVQDAAIKLTWEFSTTTLTALDVRILLADGVINTSLYRKPTDVQQFVHFDSAHPLHLKLSIPYAQLLRARRICSTEAEFEREARFILRCFAKRGYPRKTLFRALRKARGWNRRELLKDKVKVSTPVPLCFISVYQGQETRAMNGALRRLLSDLDDSPLIKERREMFDGRSPLPEGRATVGFQVAPKLGSRMGPIFKKRQVGPPHTE